jgi:hypothetical protein
MKILKQCLNVLKRLLNDYKTHNKNRRINLEKSQIINKKTSDKRQIINENFDYSKSVIYPSKQVIDLTRYLSGEIENNPEVKETKNIVVYDNNSLYICYVKFLLDNCNDGDVLPSLVETMEKLDQGITERKLRTIKNKLLDHKAIYKPTLTSRKYKVNYSKLKELYINK